MSIGVTSSWWVGAIVGAAAYYLVRKTIVKIGLKAIQTKESNARKFFKGFQYDSLLVLKTALDKEIRDRDLRKAP